MACEAEFYMTVCACSSSDSKHRSKHNSLVATRLAELLSSVGVVSASTKLEVSTCCPRLVTENEQPDHKKHYILIKAPQPVLRHSISIVNKCFAGAFADEKNIGKFTEFLTKFVTFAL